MPRLGPLRPVMCAALLAVCGAGAAEAQPSLVSGRVADAVTGVPIQGVTVAAVTLRADTVATAVTSATGEYSLMVPPGAVYFLVTRPTDAYVPAAFPNVACLDGSCSTRELGTATPFQASGGQPVIARNFALTRAGRITGTVTDVSAGTPAAGVTVEAVLRVGGGFTTRSAQTDASGAYAIGGLAPGQYVLFTTGAGQLRNEIFGSDAPCLGRCIQEALDTGAAVPVLPRGTSAGRDFALERGARLSGTVRNAATNQPADGVLVLAFTRVGTRIASVGGAYTGPAGDYTISGLPAGAYALATASGSLTNQIYPDILCPLNCSRDVTVQSGTPVVVALDTTAAGLDFALDPGGSISGRIIHEPTQIPIQNVAVLLTVRVGDFFSFRGATSNGAGVYTVSGLPPGSYQLFTNSAFVENEIFPDVPCAVECEALDALDRGGLVNVTSGATTTGRDFVVRTLPETGTLTGRVTDAATGLPIAGIGIRAYRRFGTALGQSLSALSAIDGSYSLAGPAGTYVVSTSGEHPYRNEAFDDIPCPGFDCDDIVAGATPIAVSETGPNVANFGLGLGDGISGVVRDAATGVALAGTVVRLLRVPSGVHVATGVTDASGQYIVGGVPNGTYVAHTVNRQGYVDQVHGGVPCPGPCSEAHAVATGTHIAITGAAALLEAGNDSLVPGIDFALTGDVPGAPTAFRAVTSAFTTTFSWSEPSLLAGGAAASYVIEAGFAPGATSVRIPVTGTAHAVPGVPPGVYFVRVRAVNAVGTGPASTEITLVVGNGGLAVPEPPADAAAFMSGDRLVLTWAPPTNAGPGISYLVEAGSASGLADIATLSTSRSVFTFAPVPPGFYFLRVRARNAAGISAPSGEAMIVVGTAPAPPPAPRLDVPAVSGTTVTLTWNTPRGGASRYVIEAGSATGLSNLARVDTGSAAVTQTFTGVPPGTYFVRVRAVNTHGASVASNEHVLTVR